MGVMSGLMPNGSRARISRCRGPIVQPDRKHAVQTVEAVRPPAGVGVEDDLGITAAAEACSARFEFLAQLGVVIDLRH